MFGKRRKKFEDNMAEELRFHLEQYTEDLIRAGVPAREAERRARLEFGGVESVKEECRESRGVHLYDELARNLRYAARLLVRSPRFAAAAILPFALCLGANLAIFAVVDSILLRPLPFAHADRLVVLFKTYPKVGVMRDGASSANYYERRGRIPALEQLALLRPGDATVGEPGSTEVRAFFQVTTGFFSVLGVKPLAGRVFTEEEMNPNAAPVAIVTGSPEQLGRSIRFGGVPCTIVGVLPADFRYLSSDARIFLPFASSPPDRVAAERHSGRGGELIARLKPGASIEEAQAQIDALDAATAHEYPRAQLIADAGYRTRVASLQGDHVATVRPILLLTQAGVFCLLLIGAVNLTNLLLLRASARNKELAVRLAMGAGRRHVVTEILVETLAVTTAGGVLGLALGTLGLRGLAALGLERLPLAAGVQVSARMAAAALLVSVAAGILAGLVIAWFHARSQAGAALQAESRGGTAHRASQRLRQAFTVAQVALAFVLLSGAGLLVASLRNASRIPPGFAATDGLLTGRVNLPWSTYRGTPSLLAFSERMVDELRREPGVLAAGVVTNLPLTGINVKSAVSVKDHPVPPGEPARAIYAYGVDGDYFAALQYRLLEGRFLTPDDSRRPVRVCVVDEVFARHYWPTGGAVGQLLFLGGGPQRDSEAYTIAGVVGAVKQADLTENDSHGTAYFPLGLRAETRLFLVARTAAATGRLPENRLQQIVRRVDAELPVYDVRSMEARVSQSLAVRRTPAALAVIFAAVAMLLAAVGTYGVVSYAIGQRRREIGVRMALGAQPREIAWQFLALGLELLASGTVIGVIASVLAGRAMQSLLYGVPAVYVPALLAAAGVMGAVSLAACLLPSRHAARISPVEALHGD